MLSQFLQLVAYRGEAFGAGSVLAHRLPESRGFLRIAAITPSALPFAPSADPAQPSASAILFPQTPHCHKPLGARRTMALTFVTRYLR